MDPTYPVDRLALMLDDSQARVLVTNSSLVSRLPTSNCELIDIEAPEIAQGPDHLPRIDNMPSDLSYVFYVSQGPGESTGIEIPHRALANLTVWHRKAFGVTFADRAGHVSGLGSGAAAWELWPYLTSGASIVLADDATRSSPELLRDWLVAQRITISFAPAPIAERMLSLEWPRETRLRALLTGGDTLHHYPPAGLPFAVINNYGPTECTVVAASGRVHSNARPDLLPPIGTAIANTIIHLLDENLDPVPPGTPGEIHIGGDCLARGYRNRPELTREKFIRDPFSDDPGARLYKTGDLGRLLPDGDIALLSSFQRPPLTEHTVPIGNPVSTCWKI